MIKNFYHLIILLLISIIGVENVYASHIAGQDLSFKTIGSSANYDTIVFTLNSYRNCSGQDDFPWGPLYFSSSCDTSNFGKWSSDIQKLNPKKDIWAYDSAGFYFDLISSYGPPISKTEISQLCPTNTSYCKGGAYPGIESWLWRDTLILPKCSDWRASSSRLARDLSVNVSGIDFSNTPHYTEIKFNNQLAPGNSSPVFTAQPTPYFCANQQQTYNLLPYDKDGDSLHFSFIGARTWSGGMGTMKYVAPYSATNPIDGITLNSSTGLIKFTPTTVGNFIVVVQVEEYRNGTLIGTYMRDSKYVVISCSNQVPSDTSGTIVNFSTSSSGVRIDSNTVEVCGGGDFSFDVNIYDPDGTDTLNLISNISQVLPGASFTRIRGNPARATISWTDKGSTPYFNTFQIMADDGKCPIPGQTYYAYEVKVTPGTSASDATLCDSTKTVQLNATGGNTFTWEVISGHPNSLSCTSCTNPIASPDSTTVYEVTSDLTSAGCKTIDTVTVTVLGSVFDPTITPAGPYCVTDASTKQLKAKSTGGTWTGKGVTSSGLFTPSSAGVSTHTITYALAGQCGGSDTVNIIVNAKPVTTFTSKSPYCLNASADTLKPIQKGGTWSGTCVSNAGIFTPSCAGTGTHKIKYTITSGTCTSTDSMNLIVNSIYDATITQPNPYCESDPDDTLSAKDMGGKWKGTGIIDADKGIFSPSQATAGNYIISYTIANQCGDSDAVTIVVNKQYDASITTKPIGPFCAKTDTTVTLSAVDTGGIWTINGNTNNGTFTPSVGVGTHIIQYAISKTCGDTDTVSVIVNPNADATITPVGPFCATDPAVTLQAAAGGIWTENGTSSTDTFTPSNSNVGTNQIIYTLLTACPDADTIEIVVNAIPDATFSYPEDTVIISKPSVTPNIPSTTGGTWSGNGIINATTGEFSPEKAGLGAHTITYTLTVNGCTDMKTFVIVVRGKSSLGFPNVFSPNGDAFNNEFKADTTLTKNIIDFHVVIYNRWGRKVYEWDDVNGHWDGTTFNSKKAPDGVYYYVVSAKGEDDVLYDLSGYVTLIGRE